MFIFFQMVIKSCFKSSTLVWCSNMWAMCTKHPAYKSEKILTCRQHCYAFEKV
uniref:Uncharacterized protein n=1 Tax=Anguilla anguilla TaxID=7936 RepID=A0A0E9PHG7_ANGAN